MAQRVKSAKLDTRTARLRLKERKKPYFVSLERGLSLGYRRNATAGTWVVRVVRDGEDWTKAIGRADDHVEAKDAGPDILTYGDAQRRANVIAKAGKPAGDNTVAGALERYKTNLETRGGDVANFRRVKKHLPKDIRDKAVGALTVKDLRDWRDGLLDKQLAAASVNRICTALRAALNLASDGDERITRRNAWQVGLKAIEGAGSEPRNVILPEAQVRAIIAMAYQDSDAFGEYVEVIATTGTRPSQAERLQGEDVQMGSKPRLMMPSSRKGRGVRKIRHYPVPIPLPLAKRLAGRSGDLLLRSDDRSWTNERGRRFAAAVKSAGLDPTIITLYALRHTSIVRQLLGNVPVRVVAVLHDTSVAMIERTYSKYIASHTDDLARAVMLQSAEIIPLNEVRA